MKITTLFFFLLVSLNASSQRSNCISESCNAQKFSWQNTRSITDTLSPAGFSDTSSCNLVVYSVTDTFGGYVTGNNGYGDLEKSQRYDLAAYNLIEGNVTGVFISAGKKTVAAVPGYLKCKIYSVGSSSQPDSLLGISDSVSMSLVDTTLNLTYFNFSSPVSIPEGGKFFASIELSQIEGDTLALVSTEDSCVQASGYSYEKWSNGSWHSIKNSWLLDIDLGIFPVIGHQFSSGVINTNSYHSSNRVFPNPAFNQLTVHLGGYSIYSSQLKENTFSITDIYGKVFFTSNIQEQTFKMDVSSIPCGVYLITLQTSSGKEIHKISVIH